MDHEQDRPRIDETEAEVGPDEVTIDDEAPDEPAPPPPPTGRRDHVGAHPQRDGRFYVGLAPVVGRVSGKEHAPVAHRLGNQRAQRCDRHFQCRTGDDLLRRLVRQPPPQFVPEHLVRPVIRGVGQGALDIVTA